jgi:hypothetical protein
VTLPKTGLVTPRTFSPLGVNIANKFSPTRQTLGAKTSKKCSHVGFLESIIRWPLAHSVRAQRTNFCSPPIKLQESFVLSTNGCSVKRPLPFILIQYKPMCNKIYYVVQGLLQHLPTK